MAQTSGILPASNDGVKKKIAALMQPATREGVPGLMATRNTLKGIRSSTIPTGHKPTKRGSR